MMSFVNVSIFLLYALFFDQQKQIAVPSRPQKDLAVFIAVSDYGQWQDLKHPIEEATMLAADLHDLYHFDTMVIRNPGKRAILEVIEQLIQRKFDSDGQLFIYFSGHGDFREDTKEGYFIPADAILQDSYQESYLSYQILRRRVNNIKSEHILLAIDACYSGTFDDEVAYRGLAAPGGRPEGQPEEQKERFLEQQLKQKTRLFAASGGKERTPDKSQFAQKFHEALVTKGGEENLLSFNMISSFLEKAYPTPYISGFGDHKGGGFVMIHEPDPAKASPTKNAETEIWQHALTNNDWDSYDYYLTMYPNGKYKELAEKNINIIQEQKAWEIAKQKNTSKAYQIYLNVYPNGKHAKEASEELAKVSVSTNNMSKETEVGRAEFSKDSTTIASEKMGEWLPKPPALGLEGGLSVAKSAGRSLAAYELDPVANKAKLEEAQKSSDLSIQFTDAYNSASAWITRGDIFNARLSEIATQKILNPSGAYRLKNYALYAFYAYDRALKIAQKKYEKSDALKGLKAIHANLVNSAAEFYEDKNYSLAYEAFRASLECHGILTTNLEKSAYATNEEYLAGFAYAGLCAELADNCGEAINMYNAALKGGYDEGTFIWEGLHKCYLKMNDEANAFRVLEEGRQKFPEDSSLLFVEINYYLSRNKLNELIQRLKQAIEKEPENSSLYITLANVYQRLHEDAQRNKDMTKATEYFSEALKYCKIAIQKSPKDLDAQYCAGALYYNKAALATQELNLIEGYDSASLKKYSEGKKEVDNLFSLALPYFIECEKINPNDINTLVALYEIYNRSEQNNLAEIFKTRLENVKQGGKYAQSYFK